MVPTVKAKKVSSPLSMVIPGTRDRYTRPRNIVILRTLADNFFCNFGVTFITNLYHYNYFQYKSLRKRRLRRYEILVLPPWFVVVTFGGVVGFFIWFFLLFTRLWWLVSFRNSLCCCFPHGVSAVASSFSKFRRRYPEIEASNSQPDKYKFVVKNRKGFVKVALRNGSPPLVPIVSFAETDLFDQLVQEFTRKSLWVASVIINGRGFFQCSFGIIPRKQPVTTVVEHTKIANPTNEQVEELHNKFVQSLITLFEEYKYKYLENPEDKYLELQ
ncbi:hypothetical protein GEV33_000147 [Tenebrio molitor]|uniref:Acyltransferase n=1 Tax=Tenebrio molitor TaxID=7067 RepID=A0A8J6HXH9_TENMO|nr:hypothetical protein GEV33_000147 [Tenebrio molitor]